MNHTTTNRFYNEYTNVDSIFEGEEGGILAGNIGNIITVREWTNNYNETSTKLVQKLRDLNKGKHF